MKNPRTYVIVMILMGYLSVSSIAYRLGHPDQTETELFLNIPRALAWQW